MFTVYKNDFFLLFIWSRELYYFIFLVYLISFYLSTVTIFMYKINETDYIN